MSLVATLDTGHGGALPFWGDTAVLSHGSTDGDSGRNDGFALVDISDPTLPSKIGDFPCISTGADVSVWRDLVFLSKSSRPLTSDDCERAEVAGPEGFAGVQIVSIQDPERPELIASVNTCPNALDPARCSDAHTHTLVPDLSHRDPPTACAEPSGPLCAEGRGTFQSDYLGPGSFRVAGKTSSCASFEADFALIEAGGDELYLATTAHTVGQNTLYSGPGATVRSGREKEVQDRTGDRSRLWASW